MKKWTEAYPRDNAIVDYKQFNQGYNAYKSSFNGGIDRTMTPSETFDKDIVKDKAFHYIVIKRRGDMDVPQTDSTTGTTLDDFRGLSYNTYGGGWLTVDEIDLTGMKDGMMHWEFSSHIYNNVYHSDDNPKSVSIRLLFDGLEVCSLYQVPDPVITFRMVCDFPYTASPNKATVQARSVSPSDRENDKCLFTLLSMQHLFIGRWR